MCALFVLTRRTQVARYKDVIHLRNPTKVYKDQNSL